MSYADRLKRAVKALNDGFIAVVLGVIYVILFGIARLFMVFARRKENGWVPGDGTDSPHGSAY